MSWDTWWLRRVTPPKFVLCRAGAQFRINVMSARDVARETAGPPAVPLTDFQAVLHGEDIRRPLEVRPVYPTATDFFRASSRQLGSTRRIDGFMLRAWDADRWTGPAIELHPVFSHFGAWLDHNRFMRLFGSEVGVKLDEVARASLLEELGAGPFGPPKRPMAEFASIPNSWRVSPEAARLWSEKALARGRVLPRRPQASRRKSCHHGLVPFPGCPPPRVRWRCSVGLASA